MSLTKVSGSMLQSERIWVDSFGATGDGVTDDTAAIQAAVDSVGTGQAAEIFFTPTKTYLFGSTPVIVQKSNITFNFNGCGLLMAGASYDTAIEVYPSTLDARKARTDYPSSWIIGGTPYPYENDWRTMMHESTDANRIKNFTIKNCHLDSTFSGILFTIMSVDGVFVSGNNMKPSDHSALRLWHTTDIELKGNTFGGTGIYGLFFFKCKNITIQENNFSKIGDVMYSIKGVYHGTNSIFAACTESMTDVAIKVTNNVHIFEDLTSATSPRFARVDLGLTSSTYNADIIGSQGGTAIGFSNSQWIGPGAKNIVVTENTFNSGDATTRVGGAFNIFLPTETVTISRNTIFGSHLFVAGGEGVYIEDNILDYDPSMPSIDTAPIACREDTAIPTPPLPNTGRICRNVIKNLTSDTSAEDNQGILIRATNFELSGNKLEYPRAKVSRFINVDTGSDYVIGNDNSVILGSSAVDFDPNVPVRTASATNLNGGSVFCGIVDNVSNTQSTYKSKSFGDQLNVVGLTTAGTVTLNSRDAQYTLINNTCFVQIRIQWSSLTGTGDLAITGLPFPADDGASAYTWNLFQVAATGLTYTGTQAVAYVAAGEDKIRFAQFSSAASISAIPVDAGATVYLTGSYPYKFE